MKLLEADGARPLAARDLDGGVERDERLGEIAGVSRDAVFADAEHGVATVDAGHRAAAAARIAFVAGLPVRVPEIAAARALHHVAAEGGHVADLGAGRERERLRD